MYLIAQYYLCKTNAMSSASMLSLNRIPQNSSLLLRKSKNIHRLYPLNQNSRFSFFSNPSCHYLFWIQRFVQTFKYFLFYIIYHDIDFLFFYILNSSQKIWFNFSYIFILFHIVYHINFLFVIHIIFHVSTFHTYPDLYLLSGYQFFSFPSISCFMSFIMISIFSFHTYYVLYHLSCINFSYMS